MTALLSVIIGGTIGFGLFIIMRSFTRRRVLSLTELNAGGELRGVPVSMTSDAPRVDRRRGELTGIKGVFGRLGLSVMDALGFHDAARLSDQLRVLDRSAEHHAYEKLLGAVVGFCLPVFLAVTLPLGGVSVSGVFIMLLSIVGGIAGFFYPDLPLTERVEERRRQFRHALGSYLDLVTILMAGGAGTESALEGAAEDGDGWPFAEIRAALRRASLTRTSPWEAFEELGIELGIAELQELSASVALSGAQGARIKMSLVAKADAMRAAQAAELESASERQTEKMLVPLIVMAFGVTLFVGFGAIQSITANNEGPELPGLQSDPDSLVD